MKYIIIIMCAVFVLGYVTAKIVERITKVEEKRVEEPVVPSMKFPEVEPLTVNDLPDGWKIYENQGKYRLTDPQGKKRLPFVCWLGTPREAAMDFASIDEAVLSAFEHQRRDDFAKEDNWKPVQSAKPKQSLGWMPSSDLSKIAFLSLSSLQECCDIMYAGGKSSNEVYTFYTNELKKMADSNDGKIRL